MSAHIPNDRSAPPRLAAWLVWLASPATERQFVVDDLREAFDEHVAALGVRRARRWYWREALDSLVHLVRRKISLAARAPSSAPHAPGDPMWNAIAADLRFASRLSRRSILASCAIVGTMTLGVGSTTAVFSAMNGVLLQPLPFSHSDRVVQIRGTLRDGRAIETLAYPDLLEFRHVVRDFSDITVFQVDDGTLQHGADPTVVHFVDADTLYARVFGVRLELGRGFTREDVRPSSAPVVILSHDFWTTEFGGDRAIVGRMITIDDEAVQVVGVLTEGAYTYPREHGDGLRPLIIDPNSIMLHRGAMWASAAARLAPHATVAQANRDLAAAAAQLAAQYPSANKGIGAVARDLRESIVGTVAPMLELLAAAVGAVLLIACINIANLILGRTQLRGREFAVRSALGGSPARVRQQILTESLLLASVGGAIGVAIAPFLTRALIAIYPTALPRANEIATDWRVIAVALATTLLAGVLAAIPTMRRASRLDLSNDLRDGGRSGAGKRDRRFGRLLIVSQVAASLALLFAAGLLLRTFQRLTQIDPGFDPRSVSTFYVFASNGRYAKRADIDRYYAEATNALRSIPGVDVVSSTTLLPFGGGRSYDIFIPEERGDQGANNPATAVSVSAPGFDRALGLPLLHGRAFAASDDSASAPVVMINEALAKRDYPGVDPVGHLITLGTKQHWQIIGVVGAMRLDSLSESAMPILYTTPLQNPKRGRYLLVRADAPSDRVLAAARTALHRVDPTVALTDPATMEARIHGSLAAQRFRAALMGTLGALALLLAVIGISSVVANSVTRRVREIGIRLALGEGAATVRRRVVLDALRIAVVGLLIGVPLSIAAGKGLAGFLIGVSPYDAAMLAAAAGVLALVVVAAAYGPARRAARVDPMAALRAD